MLELNEIHNPFPGIRPFEMDETNLFFGRDGQSDELLKRLQRTRLLAVVGTSGSGKSSLIRAGLLPALYGGLMGDVGSSWRIAIQRPGGDPIGNLASALADSQVFGLESNSEIQTALIETTLRRSSIGLIDVTREARLSAPENLLIVVDQFEELFRFKQSQSGDDATTFVKLLLEASAQQEIPIYIIITMRSDFLGDCSQFTGLPEAINNGQYLIPRMSRDERQSAIVGPIAVGSGQISAPLVSRLLNDVGDSPDQLPILQHALMRTWDYWSAHRRNGHPIDLEDYMAIGTMIEALSRHADEAFNELPGEPRRLIAEKLFKRLTEKGADNREIRRPTSLAELCAVCGASQDELREVVDVFRAEGRSFLMPPLGQKLSSETVIDISHESLIRNWTRLQKWVDEESQSSRTYRRLAEAAVLHREGSEGLLQDPGLQIALDWFEKSKPNAAWAQRYHPEFAEAKKYLTDSCEAREAAERERERQRNAELERERREREQAELYAAGQARAARRLRWLIVGMAVMFLLALVTAGVALAARRNAEAARLSADAARLNAELATRGVEIEKEKVATLLGETADSLRQKEDALRSRDKAEIEREKQLKTARDAQELAGKEAARANEQKLTADRATLAAKKNLTVAESAKGRSDQQNTALASFLRGDYEQAAGDFASASNYLSAEKNAIEESSSSQSDKGAEQRKLEFRRGLLLSGIGASERRLGMYDRAVSSYTNALSLLTTNNWGNETGDGNRRAWDIFDTKFGLAQAYRDLAESSRKKADDPSPTLADEKRKKYEENYLEAEKHYEEALALYEKLLRQQQSVAQHNNSETVTLQGRWASRLAVGLEELARLYRDRKEYERANPVYERILKTRENLPDKLAYLASLIETGKSYGEQAKYQEAEALLTKASDIVEKALFDNSSSDEVETIAPRMAEAYTELGNVYGAQEGKESKAENSYQLARVLQDILARAKQGEGAMEDPKGALAAYELMADAYAGLGKYDRADSFYGTAAEIGSAPMFSADTDSLTLIRILHKRAVLNREHLHYEKAEEYYKKLLEIVKATPANSPIGLPEALRDLGGLYAKEMNRPTDAEPLLKSSLELALSGKNLLEVNKTLAELVKLYRLQNRTVELENAQKTRAENAGKILAIRREAGADGLAAFKNYTEGAREYIEANSDLASRYQAQKKGDDALSLYRTMLGDPTKPESNPGSCCVILNRLTETSVIDLYARTLDQYRQLLLFRGMTDEAAKIASYLKDVESQKGMALLYRRYQHL